MDDKIRSLLVRGREHYRAGEYDQALRLLEEFASHGYPFADVYEMLGVIEHQRGNPADAEPHFKKALRINPGYTEAALNLAVTLNDLGRYDEAREVYQKVVASRSGQRQAVDPFVKGQIANMHADVGDAYVEAGLPEAAIAEYEKALSLCPTYVDIRTRLGVALRASGDWDGALRELEQAKADRPRYLAARLNLGMLHYAAQRPGDAAREWYEVLTIDPTNKFAKLYLTMI